MVKYDGEYCGEYGFKVSWEIRWVSGKFRGRVERWNGVVEGLERVVGSGGVRVCNFYGDRMCGWGGGRCCLERSIVKM